MLARRKFLGMVAASPVAAKMAAEAAAANLAGLRLGGAGYLGVPQAIAGGEITKGAWRLAVANKDALKEIRSLLFERQRHVNSIDHDLAAKKSFSLAAKVAYQRERNVQRELEDMTNEWSWSRLESIGKKFIGF